MADEGKDDTQSDRVALRPETATNFTIAADDASVMLVLSRKLLLFVPGDTEGRAALEPIGSYVLSPVIAKDLHKVLGEVISDYETRLGQIPVLGKPQNVQS